MTLGFVLPTILALKLKIGSTDTTIAQAMKHSLLESIDSRFPMLVFDDPEMLIDEGISVYENVENSKADPLDDKNSETDDYFSYFKGMPTINSCDEEETRNIVETGISNYLNDKNRTLACLDKYIVMKIIYLKHNTTAPSSASVERIFNTALQRNRLSANKFEKLFFLKHNRNA